MKVIAKWLFLLLSFLFSHGQFLNPYNGYPYWNQFYFNPYPVYTRRWFASPECPSEVRPGYCPVTQSNGFSYSICDTFHFLCFNDADCIESTKCCHHNSFQHKVCLRPIPNFPVTPGPEVVTEPSTATTEPATTFRFTEPLTTTITNMPTTMNPTTTTTESTTQTTTNSTDTEIVVPPAYMPAMNPTTTTTESTTQTTTSSTYIEFGGLSGDGEDDDDYDPSMTESTIRTTTNSIVNTEDGRGSGSGDDDEDDNGSGSHVPAQ